MVRGLIDAGFVSPMRGKRREYRFNFQDLVVLRAARALADAKLPTTRILRSLRRLRAQLPGTMPMSGLRVEAMGDAVVVVDGDTQWRPDSGQYVMRFQAGASQGRVAFIEEPPEPSPSASKDDLFEQAVALESSHADAACTFYRRIIAMDEAYAAAYTNLGRLLHMQGKLKDAEAIYRQGMSKAGSDGVLLFNLGVLLEDLKRPLEAAERYRAALKHKPDLRDAHFNLAALCQARGLRQEAFRHLSAFRKLGGKLE